ncbi:MAG TPA: hypothetical protein VK457_25045 [Chloroflexota bacterium]|nr:hypothetical protein [Chloroflexota bacterium]
MTSVQRVLLVTGDEELAMLLQLELGDMFPQLSINLVVGLPAALALAKARKPDLIVLGADGWPVDARHILLLLRTVTGKQTRFILIGRGGSWEKLEDLPVLAVLRRPVHLQQLEAVLAQAMQEPITVREDVGVETRVSR